MQWDIFKAFTFSNFLYNCILSFPTCKSLHFSVYSFIIITIWYRSFIAITTIVLHCAFYFLFSCLWYLSLKCILYCFPLSIRNQTENSIITNLADGSFVWIGLYREKLWSDGSTSLFRHWAIGQPDLSGEECVTTSFNDSGRWSDENCALNFSFICFKTSNASYFCSYTI